MERNHASSHYQLFTWHVYLWLSTLGLLQDKLKTVPKLSLCFWNLDSTYEWSWIMQIILMCNCTCIPKVASSQGGMFCGIHDHCWDFSFSTTLMAEGLLEQQKFSWNVTEFLVLSVSFSVKQYMQDTNPFHYRSYISSSNGNTEIIFSIRKSLFLGN